MKTITESPRVESLQNKELEKRHSLSRILLGRSLLVAAGGLFFYTAFEMLFDPPTDILNYITHHFIHVIGIGIAVWWVCWWTLRENVFVPVSTISQHLSRMRFGRLQLLSLRSQSNEMQTIVEGINSMTESLRKAKPGELERALTYIQELRVRLGKLAVKDEEQKVPVMKCLTRLESSLLSLVSREHHRKA